MSTNLKWVYHFQICISWLYPQQKNVCIIKHCFGLMYCNDRLWGVVDLLLRFFVQDQRGREDFRKALFISLSNRIYIPLWVVLVCSNMTSVPKRLGSKYTLGKNTSNKQFFVSVFFYDLLFVAMVSKVTIIHASDPVPRIRIIANMNIETYPIRSRVIFP